MPILKGVEKTKKTPFGHFGLATLQFSHCSHNFGGKKHHVFAVVQVLKATSYRRPI